MSSRSVRSSRRLVGSPAALDLRRLGLGVRGRRWPPRKRHRSSPVGSLVGSLVGGGGRGVVVAEGAAARGQRRVRRRSSARCGAERKGRELANRGAEAAALVGRQPNLVGDRQAGKQAGRQRRSNTRRF
jgi:hypothetical protein